MMCRGLYPRRNRPVRWDMYGGFGFMVRQVKVSNFSEVKEIVSAAAKCYNEVGVHDMKGSNR